MASELSRNIGISAAFLTKNVVFSTIESEGYLPITLRPIPIAVLRRNTFPLPGKTERNL
jgi:hypothetical protein